MEGGQARLPQKSTAASCETLWPLHAVHDDRAPRLEVRESSRPPPRDRALMAPATTMGSGVERGAPAHVDENRPRKRSPAAVANR
jgi:hypothetical protein